MADSEWTEEMDLHLLRNLTEMPNTPDAFPENVQRAGPLKASEKNYYQTIQDSFQTYLHKEVSQTSIRKRAAFFLGALEPTSEAVILVVRAVHACALEDTTVEDIRERIAQRDAERTARLRSREKGVFLPKERDKRSATDVAAASRCTCGTSPADCPLRDHAHYVLRCSVPGAADSEGPRVEEFEYMSGQPVDTPARTAFLQAARALADLPSDKEVVFLALLKEGLCGFLVDDIASVQGSPLSEDAVHILLKVGVLSRIFVHIQPCTCTCMCYMLPVAS